MLRPYGIASWTVWVERIAASHRGRRGWNASRHRIVDGVGGTHRGIASWTVWVERIAASHRGRRGWNASRQCGVDAAGTRTNMQTKPLHDRRVAVTRAAEQSGALVEQLEALGATVLVCPLISIAPLSDPPPLAEVVQHIARYDWLVVPSANAARALLDVVADVCLFTHIRIAAIGSGTANLLRECGLRVELVPEAHSAAGLLHELGDLAGQRVLLPQGDIARPELAAGLRERGATVDAVIVYRTVPGAGVDALVAALQRHELDAVTFASPSALAYLIERFTAQGISPQEYRSLFEDLALVAIGPTTATTLREAGLPVAALAEPHTAAGLAQAVVTALGDR
jgi:uroporphyrinogen-III synthase